MLAAGCAGSASLFCGNRARAQPVVVVRSTNGVSRNGDFIDRLPIDRNKFKHIADCLVFSRAAMDVDHNTDISRRQSEIGQVSRQNGVVVFGYHGAFNRNGLIVTNLGIDRRVD